MTKAYFNGKIVSAKSIKINPYDIGILRGYGVFDVMCTQNNKPFLIKEHFDRLKNSAAALKLKLPFSEKKYQVIVGKLIKNGNFKKSIIRTILTGGVSANAFSKGRPTCYILIEKFLELPKRIYDEGAAVITHEFERHLPRAKVTNYVEAIRNQEIKEKNKALEIIYIKNGIALEASTSNFFIVDKKGKLITSKEGILLGTTRNLIVKLAVNKFKVEERSILENELRGAKEVFLTATNKDVVPVVKIDGDKVGNGKVGEKTKVLMNLFNNFVNNY